MKVAMMVASEVEMVAVTARDLAMVSEKGMKAPKLYFEKVERVGAI